MRFKALFLVVFCLFGFSVSPVLAGEIESVTMISLADSFSPWTLTVRSDGWVEWKKSSSGYLLDSVFGEPEDIPRKQTTAGKEEVAALFTMVADAGYTETPDQSQEPAVKLVVTLHNGGKVTNNGPGSFAPDDAKKAFREIERGLVGLAGFDYREEVKKYNETSSEPSIFLFYSVVHGDL